MYLSHEGLTSHDLCTLRPHESLAMSSIGIEFRQVTKRYGDASAPLVVKGIDLNE